MVRECRYGRNCHASKRQSCDCRELFGQTCARGSRSRNGGDRSVHPRVGEPRRDSESTSARGVHRSDDTEPTTDLGRGRWIQRMTRDTTLAQRFQKRELNTTEEAKRTRSRQRTKSQMRTKTSEVKNESKTKVPLNETMTTNK